MARKSKHLFEGDNCTLKFLECYCVTSKHLGPALWTPTDIQTQPLFSRMFLGISGVQAGTTPLPLPQPSSPLKVREKVARSCPTLCHSCHDPYSPWNSPGQNTGVGSVFLLQKIFQTQGSKLDLPHCEQILYHLSHKGSPRILEWVTYPLSRGTSRPRNRTRVSCIAGEFFTN